MTQIAVIGRAIVVCVALEAALSASIAQAPAGKTLKASDSNTRVSAQTVAKFLGLVAGKQSSELRAVWTEATQTFPAGATIENYPDVFKGRLPTQQPKPLILIAAQLARDGIKEEEVEALTLFRGANGLVTVDVIMVVRKADRTIAGMYQGWWGR